MARSISFTRASDPARDGREAAKRRGVAPDRFRKQIIAILSNARSLVDLELLHAGGRHREHGHVVCDWSMIVSRSPSRVQQAIRDQASRLHVA